MVSEIGFFPNEAISHEARELVLTNFFHELILSNIESGTNITELLILCSFVDLNGFIGNPLSSVLMPEAKFSQKVLLSSWCFLDDEVLLEGVSESSNSVIILAISGPHVSQRIKAESSRLLTKSVAPPVDLITRLFCSWTWSSAILENWFLDFWKEKKPFLDFCTPPDDSSPLSLSQIYAHLTTWHN